MDNEDNEDGNKEEVQQQNDAVNNDEISTPIQTLNTKDNQDKSNINIINININTSYILLYSNINA
jgi:hypothetical protein